MIPKRRRFRVLLVIVAVLLVGLGVRITIFLTKDEPQNYANVIQQFKYGSVGTEQDQGIPYFIWSVLPDVFSDLLPAGAGTGYERFGFIYEDQADEQHPRPIGATYREKPVPLIGLNCASCHVGTVRASPSTPAKIVLGMPATGLKLSTYIGFLRAVGRDPRFNADELIPAIRKRFKLSYINAQFYRHAVIPKTKSGLQKVDRDFKWLDYYPAAGPGRVSTFSSWKVKFDLDPKSDNFLGVVDFPSVWNQQIRKDMSLHWDGNNASLLERNISASLASGATADSLDLNQLDRVTTWLQALPAPKFPPNRIDRDLAGKGASSYEQHCASCHDIGGPRIGKVTPLNEIGTDPTRADSFDSELVTHMNSLGNGKPWAFSHFRNTDGYANAPLDGLWLRAPYLHNGSVPNLRALLFPAERPVVFYTGYDVYDWKSVGFVSSGAARKDGFRYDTRLQGNSNAGHLFGTTLPTPDRLAILEYLKTK